MTPWPPSGQPPTSTELAGGLHLVEHGGQGWTTSEWFLVEEQFGRNTNACSWYMPTAYNVWRSASDHLVEKWLKPALRGELHDAYAVTEKDAGSDPSGIPTTAVKQCDGGYVINGEKWFVTYGSVAAVIVVMANVIDGDQKLPTLFAVPVDAPGVSIVDDPPFTHHYPHGHPTMLFDGVKVSAEDVIGGVGPRRRPATHVVHRGAPRYRRALHRRHAATHCGDHRVGHWSRTGRCTPDRPPRRLVPPRRLGGRCSGRTPARVRRRTHEGRRRRPEADSRTRVDGQALLLRSREPVLPTARCRSSADAATCAPTPLSASGESCASTASGRAPARFSVSSLRAPWKSAASTRCSARRT